MPADDRRRLRRKQRRYLEEWVRLLCLIRPTLTQPEARTLVRCCIGAIQAPLFATIELDDDDLRRVLAATAGAVLGL